MQERIDGERANDNGGWQWTDDTGTDAAPYSRIVHPGAPEQDVRPRRGVHPPLGPGAR